jgi:hypothetical protein
MFIDNPQLAQPQRQAHLRFAKRFYHRLAESAAFIVQSVSNAPALQPLRNLSGSAVGDATATVLRHPL